MLFESDEQLQLKSLSDSTLIDTKSLSST